MKHVVTWAVELDALTAAILATAAEHQGLLAEELAAQVLYQQAALRVGWPNNDGRALRAAWRDWMSQRARAEDADA